MNHIPLDCSTPLAKRIMTVFDPFRTLRQMFFSSVSALHRQRRLRTCVRNGFQRSIITVQAFRV